MVAQKEMYTLLVCGRVDGEAQDKLRRSVAALLSAPEFGCDYSSLVIGPGPSAPVHLPAGERVPEPAAA